jgi:hypothetical protein
MTRTKRAWRKANAYVRSGQHAKAIYWLSRTQTLLDGKPARPLRVDGMEASYMLGALAVLIVVWAAVG